MAAVAAAWPIQNRIEALGDGPGLRRLDVGRLENAQNFRRAHAGNVPDAVCWVKPSRRNRHPTRPRAHKNQISVRLKIPPEGGAPNKTPGCTVACGRMTPPTFSAFPEATAVSSKPPYHPGEGVARLHRPIGRVRVADPADSSPHCLDRARDLRRAASGRLSPALPDLRFQRRFARAPASSHGRAPGRRPHRRSPATRHPQLAPQALSAARRRLKTSVAPPITMGRKTNPLNR